MGFYEGIIIGMLAGGIFGMLGMACLQAAKCSDCKGELVRDIEMRLRGH